MIQVKRISAGVLIGRDEDTYQRLKFLQNAEGSVPSPFDCYLALRGLKTLHVRMAKHTENATRIATYLAKHPKGSPLYAATIHNLVSQVIYPGLPSHPQYKVAQKQMLDAGGLIAICLRGGLQQARQFLEHLNVRYPCKI